MSDMLSRLNAMTAKLDAALQPERCDDATERMEIQKPRNRIDLTWDRASKLHYSKVNALAWMKVMFNHLRPHTHQAVRGAAMNRALPGALIERERYCDICGTCTTAWTEAVITKGGEVKALCGDCVDDLAGDIANVHGWESANQAAEDAAQEGE